MASPVTTASRQGDTLRAAHQAGLLFLISAVLSLVATTSIPDRRDPLLLLAATDVAIAVVIFLLPWRRWPAGSTAALAVAAWTVIGGSTWAIGGIGTGGGAFFVLAFAWMGLHHSRRMILVNAPVAAFAYLVALVLRDAARQSLTGTVVVISFAVSIGLIIEGRVRRLKAAREVIVEEQRWRAALMATLAHDIRSPLTTIHGVLEIIAEDADLPAHLQPLVASAARQTSRLSTLASTLLDLERVEGGKLVLDWQDVDVEELSQQVAELLGSTDVSVDVESGLTVRADPTRLQQMMVNLGTNAQRHGEPPVVIGARSLGAGVEMFVRDHGAGVPVADRPLLFQRLNRTDGNPESVGLGLWIVRLLAQAHGGDAVYRPADPGSEFVITLPGRSILAAPRLHAGTVRTSQLARHADRLVGQVGSLKIESLAVVSPSNPEELLEQPSLAEAAVAVAVGNEEESRFEPPCGRSRLELRGLGSSTCTSTSDLTPRQRRGTTTPAPRSGRWRWPRPSRRRWTSTPG